MAWEMAWKMPREMAQEIAREMAREMVEGTDLFKKLSDWWKCGIWNEVRGS